MSEKECTDLINSEANRQSRIPLTLCIVFFLVTFFLNKDFDIRYLYNYMVVMAFLAFSFWFDGMLRINRNTMLYVFLALLFVFYMFLPNAARNAETTNNAISILLFTLCCVMSMPSDWEIKTSTRIIILWAIFVSLYVLMVKVAPNVYWDMIYPHLSATARQEAVDLMRNNSYGVAMGGSAVYAEYIMALGAFFIVGRLFRGRNSQINTCIYVALLGLFLLGMVVQNRRSEVLAGIFSIFVVIALRFSFNHVTEKSFKKFMTVVAAGFLGIVFMFTRGMLDRYISTFAGLGSGSASAVEEVGNGRVALWREAIHMFGESPFFGIGWRQFSERNFIPTMEGINVHNDYLQWMCETGIIGFILITVPFVYLFAKSVIWCRTVTKRGSTYSREVKEYAIISCEIQTFYIVMHFMDPCFYKLMFWAIYTFAIILYNLSRVRAQEGNI